MRKFALAVGIVAAGALLAACPADSPAPPPRTPTAPPTVPPAPVTPPAPAPAGKGDVELIVTAPATAATGEEFEYSLVVRNRSRVDVHNVVVTDVLPASLEHVSSEPAAQVTGPLLTWQLGSLEPYAAEHLRVRVRGAAAGTAESKATVRADGGLVDEGSAVIQIGGGGAPGPAPGGAGPGGATPAGAARLSVVLTCDASVLVCDPVKYRATVRNGGTVQVTGARIGSELPDGLATRAGVRTLALDVGTLAPGTERTLEFELLAQRPGEFTTTATLRGDGVGSATATCVTRAVRPVLLVLMDAPATARSGEVVSVRTTVRNEGDGPARDVRVRAELPPGTTFVDATDGGTLSGGRFVDWSLPIVEPGRSSAVTLRLQPATAGSIQTLATAEGYCADRASASARTQVSETPPELQLTCTPSTSVVTVGDDVVYAIDVTNAAPRAAQNVVVVCRVPPGQTFRSAEAPAGIAYRVAGDTVTFDPLPSVASMARATFRVTTAVVGAGAEPFSVSLTSARLTQPLRDETRVSASAPTAADIAAVVSVPPAVTRDEPFACTIVVRNAGSRDLLDAAAQVQLPAGTEFVSASPPANLTGATSSWNLGTLRAGESRTLTLTVRARSTGALELCADATAAGNTPFRHCARTTVGERSSLGIEVTCAETTLVCDPVTYRVVVTNSGARRLENVRVRANLPTGLLTDRGEPAVDLLVGWVQPGASREVTFDARADRPGTFETVLEVRASTGETAQTRCTATVARPVLEVATAGADEGAAGEAVSYTITVRNVGDGPARDCVVEHPLPAGTTLASASDGGIDTGGVVTWNLGVIEPAATRSVTVGIMATEPGTVTHTTSATGYCCETVTATRTTKIETAPPTLRIDCSVPRNVVRVGGNIECTVTVRNAGSIDATNVVVVCALPREQEAVSATTSAGVSHTLGTRRVTFDAIPVLAPGQSAVFRVVAEAKAAGTVRFAGVVQADGMSDVQRAFSDEIRQPRRGR